jgi:hypothetical protein
LLAIILFWPWLTGDSAKPFKDRCRSGAKRRSEQSLQSVNLTTPAQAEQDIPLEASFADASSSGSAKIENVSSPTIILAEDDLKVFSSPAESSMKPPMKPTDPSMADTVEKKLSTSTEQIEKIDGEEEHAANTKGCSASQEGHPETRSHVPAMSWLL